jgi:hypothetical protein
MLIEKQKTIDIIRKKQNFYIDLAKKDKSKKKEVDAILTATTLIICEIEKLGESSFEALYNLEGIDKIKE